MSDDEREVDHEGKSEAQVKMEADAKRRKEKELEEWKEYEEMRRADKEKEAAEIQQLRERRERRKLERAEEEKRLAELRAVEEQKRRAEEEERSRKKREEAERKRQEREAKKKENEERSKQSNQPNFVINKRLGGLMSNNEEQSHEEKQKSKEQLEAERKAVLTQRITPLNTNGLNTDQLKDKARELHQYIYKLESDNYDMQQQFEQQNIDMMELADRARQMNKGGKSGQKVNMSADDAKDSKKSRAPPKVVMYSQYERIKDPRTFDDRQTVFTGPMYQDEYIRIFPENKVEMGDQGAKVVGPYEGQSNGPVSAGNEENAAPAEE